LEDGRWKMGLIKKKIPLHKERMGF